MKKHPDHILIVTDDGGTGGTTTFLRNILHELSQQHVMITVLRFKGESEKSSILPTASNIRVQEMLLSNTDSVRSLPRRVMVLLQFLWSSSESFSLVFSDYLYASACINIALWLKGIAPRRVYHFHSFYQHDKLRTAQFTQNKKNIWWYSFLYSLEKAYLRSLSEIVVFSSYAQQLLEQQSINLQKIHTISPGLDFWLQRRSSSSSELEMYWNKNKKVVAIVGRIEPRKGIHLLLKHIAQKGNEYKEALFVVVSDFSSSHFNLFTWLSKNTNFQENVVFIHQPNSVFLQQLYKHAHFVAFPSTEHETFGFVVTEALQNRTPVLAFNTGAPAELLDKNWLVPFLENNRWEAFGAAMKKKIKAKKQLVSQKKLQKIYSWKNYTKYLLVRGT